MVYLDLMHMCKSNPPLTSKKSNLTQLEQKALENLTNNDSIIIKPADKGGAIVVQNKGDYTQEALTLLSDSHTYKTIPNNLLLGFLKEATQLINRALNESIISKTEA